MGGFFMALRDGQLMGIRAKDGRVITPPLEYDPDTGAALGSQLVPVGPGGTVESWTWVSEPSPKHPLDRPFAFALVKPDGSDTSMVAAVDAGSVAAMSTGMKVKARLRQEPQGLVTDLEAWEPVKA